jgi:hypothetical protein
MPPQPSFGERPSPVERDDSDVRASDASNEAVFGDEAPKLLEELTTEELFRKRKAHEVQMKLGYREESIDITIINEIRDLMRARGISEDEYSTFLNTRITTE